MAVTGLDLCAYVHSVFVFTETIHGFVIEGTFEINSNGSIV